MGADARLFEPQRAYGFRFEVPVLPDPAPGEDMLAYAARIRDQLDLAGPCVVGGVSFGGMVACEVARVCTVRCVLLIASCRNRDAVPSHYRLAELASRLVPDFLIKRRALVSGRMLAALECLNPEQQNVVCEMSRDVDVPQLRRISRMILRWQAPATLPCPVYQIHGDADRIIPIRRVKPDEIVRGGGHLINMTHADQVNRFIERYLAGAGHLAGDAEPTSRRSENLQI